MSPIFLAVLIVILIIIRAVLHFRKDIKLKEEHEKIFKEYADSIIFAGIAALFIITFIVRPFFIPSTSMVPTLKVGDFLIVNKYVYRFHQPARKDIIVFHPPEAADAGDKDYIKRIVAVEGDRLAVSEGKLILNGKPLEEGYILEPIHYEMEEVVVPPGHYFVMGDNRNNSGDSHVWGFLPKEGVIGKAAFIFWPPTRIGKLR